MNRFEIEQNKSPEECISIIKSSIQKYGDLSKDFMPPKYSYKINKGNILIIGRGIGLPDTVLNIEFLNTHDVSTKLIGTFEENILSRAFIWVVTIFLFLMSISFIRGIIIGEIVFKDAPIITCGLPLLVLTVSLSYLVYAEKGMKRQQKRIISLVNEIFDHTRFVGHTEVR